MGVFDWVFSRLTAKADAPEMLMIDATHLKAHRTAASLLKKGRNFPASFDKTLYKQRHKIENMFGGSKTGDASQPDMIVAHTHSSQQSVLPHS